MPRRRPRVGGDDRGRRHADGGSALLVTSRSGMPTST